MTSCPGHPSRWHSADIDDGTWAHIDEVDEPLGTKDKFWVQDRDGTKWLFKFARERQGVVRGEDWAEWLTSGLGMSFWTPGWQAGTGTTRTGQLCTTSGAVGWRHRLTMAMRSVSKSLMSAVPSSLRTPISS